MTRMTSLFQAATITCFQLVLLGFAVAMVRFATLDGPAPSTPRPTASEIWTAPDGASLLR